MKNKIHYLVQNPDDESQLVHPLLLPKDYYAMGSFYILGENKDDLEPCYLFDAIHGDGRITTILNISSNNKTGTVITEDIGTFRFSLRTVTEKQHVSGYNVIKEVVPEDEKLIEEACHKHKLYFAGI